MNGDYSLAVHALVHLDYCGGCVPSRELADSLCVNAVRVRRVMRPLATAGLVHTREGMKGGYLLARPAEDITLCEVAQAVGAALVQADWTPREADGDEDRLVAASVGRVLGGIYGELNDLCLARLERTTICDITDSIFDGAASVA